MSRAEPILWPLIKSAWENLPNGRFGNLAPYNAERRSIWKPLHMQPVFDDCDFIKVEESTVNGGFLNVACLCLATIR